jgi:acetyl-CoA carboxylase beta subunit
MTDGERLARGGVVVIGRQVWQKCQWCEQVIRLNKPIFGSWHICLTDEEMRAKSAARRAQFADSQARAEFYDAHLGVRRSGPWP